MLVKVQIYPTNNFSKTVGYLDVLKMSKLPITAQKLTLTVNIFNGNRQNGYVLVASMLKFLIEKLLNTLHIQVVTSGLKLHINHFPWFDIWMDGYWVELLCCDLWCVGRAFGFVGICRDMRAAISIPRNRTFGELGYSLGWSMAQQHWGYHHSQKYFPLRIFYIFFSLYLLLLLAFVICNVTHS